MDVGHALTCLDEVRLWEARHALHHKKIAARLTQCLAELAEESAIAAAAAQENDNPAEVSAEAASAVMFEASGVASAVAATAAQDQDQEDQVRTIISSCLALTSTSTICCCYITHVKSSIIFFTLHHMCNGLP